MPYILPETELSKLKVVKKNPHEATFVIEPLSPGFGVTIGHALRRVLLSSLEGASIWSLKIEGVTHEFTSIKGVKEDMVEVILNLKTLRLKILGDDQAVLKLNKKGPGVVRAKDFTKNADVELVDPEHYIATLDKGGRLEIEATAKNGRGYIPTEARKDEKLPLGTIAVDANFTPIKKINYEVEATRVGARTDFDRLVLDITTDGTVEPERALQTACQILLDHYGLIAHENQIIANKKSDKIVKSSQEKATKKTKTAPKIKNKPRKK